MLIELLILILVLGLVMGLAKRLLDPQFFQAAVAVCIVILLIWAAPIRGRARSLVEAVMPNVTVCTNCGSLYEAGSEEEANEPSMTISGPPTHAVRYCPDCVTRGVVGAMLKHLKFADPNQAARVREQLLADDDDALGDS